MQSALGSKQWPFILGISVLFLFLLQISTPVVHAISCQVHITSIDYPLKVQPGTSIEVTTQLTATCTQSDIAISGRTDLVDSMTDQALSISHFVIGYVPSPQGVTVNETTSNRAQVPNVSGIWEPRVEVRLTVGEGTTWVGLARQPLTILVGDMGQTAFTAPISMNNLPLEPNATQTYVQVSSNSTVRALHYDPARRLINFTVSGPTGTNGSTALIFRKSLIQGSPVVVIDGGNITARILSVTTNSTHYLLIFSYPHSTHTVVVSGSETVAEFDPRILQSILLTLIAASAVTVRSKRHAKFNKRTVADTTGIVDDSHGTRT